MRTLSVDVGDKSMEMHSWEADWSLRHVLLGLAPVVVISTALRSVPDVLGQAGVIALWAAQWCWLGVFPSVMRRSLAIPNRSRRIDFAGIGYGFLVGLGLLVVSVSFGILGGDAQFEADSQAIDRLVGGATVPAAAVAFAIFGSTVGPWIEERFFRGFLLQALARQTSFPLGVVLQALLFALVHSYGLVASLSVFISGVALGAVARRRGTLVIAVTAHIALNTSAFSIIAVESQRSIPWIGIRAEPLNEESRQFQVLTHVEVDSPAARAGLLVGDMLYTADGYAMPSSFRDFARWVQGRSVGETIVLQFRRETQYYRTEVVLEEFPTVDEHGRREQKPATDSDGR